MNTNKKYNWTGYMYVSFADHSSETGVFCWAPFAGVELLSYRPSLWHSGEYTSFKRQQSSTLKRLISGIAVTVGQPSVSGGCPSLS